LGEVGAVALVLALVRRIGGRSAASGLRPGVLRQDRATWLLGEPGAVALSLWCMGSARARRSAAGVWETRGGNGGYVLGDRPVRWPWCVGLAGGRRPVAGAREAPAEPGGLALVGGPAARRSVRGRTPAGSGGLILVGGVEGPAASARVDAREDQEAGPHGSRRSPAPVRWCGERSTGPAADAQEAFGRIGRPGSWGSPAPGPRPGARDRREPGGRRAGVPGGIGKPGSWERPAPRSCPWFVGSERAKSPRTV
jgi:hypothetical protein